MPEVTYNNEGSIASSTATNTSLTAIATETGNVGSDNIKTGTLGREHLDSSTVFTVTKAGGMVENSAAAASYTGAAYQLIAHGGGMSIMTPGLTLEPGETIRFNASILMTAFTLDQATTDEGRYNFQFWWTYNDGGGNVTSSVEGFTWYNGYLIRDASEAASKSAFKNIRRGMSYIYSHTGPTTRTITNVNVRVAVPNVGDSVTLKHFVFSYTADAH